MKTHLPVPERTLPPESARRIRTSLTADRLDDGERPPARWLVPVAAALVVIALMATAVVLWPNAARTEVAATPAPIELTWTPGPGEQGPPFARDPVPTFLSSADPTSGPTSPSDVFRTDRGPFPSEELASALRWCAGEVGSADDAVVGGYARRVSNGQTTVAVLVFRLPDGSEWICGPDEGAHPSIGREAAGGESVVVRPMTYGGGENDLSSEFLYATRPGIARVQARAVIEDKPQPWFEAEVHGGLAYLPMFNTGRFVWVVDKGLRDVRFEHRAFDADGHEVPVTVHLEQGR